ncbi:tRNA lysidine(34) synthetase TilS [Gracilibacillus salinarum]|uniref:tRNA(Ile)-lysidine synthase n=1 Tax=Gracilibacillus salinarum TaxID=2932255 RepID=A0ABY4GJC4_9BACI|nr:tRNA lysidine(34) synthetase TilS [Gracilibacillus salinarum]UOQ83867.1 tRNA lysidine(34) synthetase TilS [Gracilibacillus salinarum]
MKKIRLDDKVIPFIKRHQLIHNKATVLVGVSGGADSLLLLHCMNEWQREWGLNLVAMSIDHGLRGEESREDLQYVERICKEWDIPFIAKQVDVIGRKVSHKEGTQEAARTLRYQAFQEVMEEIEADYLALAHHGDDQVETIMMKLARQTNPAALTGIPVKRRFATGYIVRPFLCLSKAEIYQQCEDRGITPREDPSNHSTVYTRNFFRKYVLPYMKQQNEHIHQHVQQLTERISEDQEYLKQEADKMLKEVVSFEENGVFFTIDVFLAYPIALQRRAFHLILNYLYSEIPKDLAFQHEKDFFSLLHHKKSNVSIDFPQSLQVIKSYQELRFRFLIQDDHQYEQSPILEIPGSSVLPDGATLKASIRVDASVEDRHILHIPTECEALFPLQVRTRQDGDRMKVRGLNGRKKVKDIFIDEKIPAYQRACWPIIIGADGSLLWIAGLKKAEIPKAKKQGKYVELTYCSLIK